MSPLFKKKAFPSVAENSVQTEGTRTFEGRPLARQAEDVEDQGLAFDLGTLLNRRRAFGVAGAGAGALLLAACGADNSGTQATASATASGTAAASTTEYTEEMPQETAGPYPGDGSNGPDVLDATGMERSDLTTSIGTDTTVEGVPMTLTIKVLDLSNKNQPMVGAAVYAWHCDAQGNYSMYSDGFTEETWLRGIQVTGDDGTVTFTSIVPGCYTGRWPHIHFEVFSSIDDITDATNAILTSQIAVPEETCSTVYALDAYSGSADNLSQITLETDNVFSDGWDMQVAAVSGDKDQGFTLSIDVPIDPTTEPEAAEAAPAVGGAPAGQDGGTPPEPPTGG